MATGNALSSYLEAALLNAVFRNTTYTSPATVYMGLFTTLPGIAPDGTGGVEVTGNAYARQAVTFGAPGAAGDGSQKCTNTGVITFPTATPGNWGTIVGVGIFDAVTAGNLLYWGPPTANQTINAGGIFSQAVGDLAVQLA